MTGLWKEIYQLMVLEHGNLRLQHWALPILVAEGHAEYVEEEAKCKGCLCFMTRALVVITLVPHS